ncbi:ABC transporter ATP-binding protein [Aeromicrobium sp.]|uniref:ABC transporter transmembrane domain-containing protein n=1 Tax=Aeromicrobium sp. TaxID=1871063 RepID=UPI0025BCD6E4|nr:ABC transporter ATP-binding protein [Aeromicrobium sp.]MCK5891898.1 ABC transporter ATP-binding protein [Aeromicrobium sp.]
MGTESSTAPATVRTSRQILFGPLTRNAGLIACGTPLIVLWQLCEALVPVMIGVTIDVGVETGDLGPFLLSCLAIAVIFTFLSYGYRFGATFMNRAVQLESHRIRLEVAGQAVLPADDPKLAGEWLSLATADADKVSLLVRQFGFTVASVVTVGATAVYLARTDVTLALVILFGVPITVGITQLVSPVVARRTEREQAAIARVAGLGGDLVAGLRPIKGIGAEDAASGRYRASSRAARASSIVTARSWGYMTGLTTVVSGLFLAVVAWLAGSKAMEGDLTLGELVAIVGLTQFLAEPIALLGALTAQFAASTASARRLHTALASPVLILDGPDRLPAGVPRELRLRRATTSSLTEVDLTCGPGQLVAVVCDRPASADSLIGLLDGSVRPDGGAVTIAGVDLRSLAAADRRATLLVVPHEASPPEGTIRTAIDPDGTLDPATLDEVLTASAGHDVVAAHPDGLDHAVRSGGSSLSGGQRQRLTLARSLAVAPPVLVLRDPTTAIDAVTEQQIATGLQSRLGRDTATLVVTTSPTLLAAADHVVWIREGRVVRVAPHHVLQEDPRYREEVLR